MSRYPLPPPQARCFATAVLLCLSAPSARAVDFRFDAADIEGMLDIELAYGVLWRV